jgi:hypothetical protein
MYEKLICSLILYNDLQYGLIIVNENCSYMLLHLLSNIEYIGDLNRLCPYTTILKSNNTGNEDETMKDENDVEMIEVIDPRLEELPLDVNININIFFFCCQ